MNYFNIAISFLLLPAASGAQNIAIRDISGKIVNNDTLVCEPGFTQKPPLTKIDCYLFAQNTGSATMIMGAKKTELTLSPNVEHAICFGKQCFLPAVFVSPLNDTVMPGGTDSTFSGHYRYDKLTLPPTQDLVAYTLYDVNNPADSAIVYVLYNSMPAAASIKKTEGAATSIAISPNPAVDMVSFSYQNAKPFTLVVVDDMGKLVTRHTIHEAGSPFLLSTSGWAPGAYYCLFFFEDGSVSKGRFIVTR